MIRSFTLLPALVILFGLGGASLAMAANASSDKPNKSQAAQTDVHEAKTTTKAVTSDPNSSICTNTATTENCTAQGN
ncbi:hypothetical protein [Hypericibacter sp.]|uniref:hypothetical protein n=1 Tax=Hypericibacter sp. TaxID=2705401 RepID=UPI003D6CF2CC